MPCAANKHRKQGAPEQLTLFKSRGGKRPGAGRPARGARAGAPHKQRPFLHERHPVHVVLRVVAAVGNLRRRDVYHAIRLATLTTARRERFHIIHLSIQRTHLHLLVEAADKAALASGMQGFQISAAKHLNAALRARPHSAGGAWSPRSRNVRVRSPGEEAGDARDAARARMAPRRRGTVFPDRYHAEIITSPRRARYALSYVMNNWRKHREDRSTKTRGWGIDWFSSAAMFPDWREYRDDEAFLWRGPATYEPLQVFRPRTWLLREGWKRHTSTISCREVPSSPR